MRPVIGVTLLTLGLLATLAPGQVPKHRSVVEMTSDGRVLVEGVPFESWDDYFSSDLAWHLGARCGTPLASVAVKGSAMDLSVQSSKLDCALGITRTSDVYEPSLARFRIPVVVHMLVHATTNAGLLTQEIIDSQIDVLNEDFLALVGTNGGNGTNIEIEFYLADTDPEGNPTTGVTTSFNTTWFLDDGDYYDVLSWDPHHYLNIYTNTAGGNLGYVLARPQFGFVGDPFWDRVVVHYEAFGRVSPREPFDLGRTATHEVGHYLGLLHVFQMCDVAPCERSGDLICDTAPQEFGNGGCTYFDSCGVPDSPGNYMDFIDDICMERFTPIQAQRMRCTLMFWRPDLLEIVTCNLEAPDCNGNCLDDADDLAQGRSTDANANTLPDECELARGDSDLSGTVGIEDFLAILQTWGPCPDPCPTDSNFDGVVGIQDFLNVLLNWGTGV